MEASSQIDDPAALFPEENPVIPYSLNRRLIRVS